MRGLPSILSFFRNKFNKFNNTGARMLDPLFLRLKCCVSYLKSYFWRENVKNLPSFTQRKIDVKM